MFTIFYTNVVEGQGSNFSIDDGFLDKTELSVSGVLHPDFEVIVLTISGLKEQVSSTISVQIDEGI
jgi:hypothetical protein